MDNIEPTESERAVRHRADRARGGRKGGLPPDATSSPVTAHAGRVTPLAARNGVTTTRVRTTGRGAARAGNGSNAPVGRGAAGKGKATTKRAAGTTTNGRGPSGRSVGRGRMSENRRRSVLQPGETPRTRGERTRQRVAGALIELVDEGDASPTAKAVAERAGVSVRLVFHHFADMDALYGLALQVQDERHWSDMREVPSGSSQAERVERTVQQRAKLFEAIGPVRHALIPVLGRNPDLRAAVGAGEQRLRSSLEATFASDLRRAGRAKKELLDALDAATSWEAWDRLRRQQRLAPAAARRVMARTVGGLLGR